MTPLQEKIIKYPDLSNKELAKKLKIPVKTVYNVRYNMSKRPRAAKAAAVAATSCSLVADIKTIQDIGVERVRKILELL